MFLTFLINCHNFHEILEKYNVKLQYNLINAKIKVSSISNFKCSKAISTAVYLISREQFQGKPLLARLPHFTIGHDPSFMSLYNLNKFELILTTSVENL